MIHENEIAIKVLTNEFADYPRNAWHYDREYLMICEALRLSKLHQPTVISSPIELEPVLAKIEHINDLGKSTWYEVVYFDGNWRCYAGSKTFKDGEKVIKWNHAKDCL